MYKAVYTDEELVQKLHTETGSGRFGCARILRKHGGDYDLAFADLTENSRPMTPSILQQMQQAWYDRVIEVTSDHKTCWVNINGICRGRFCPVSAEYVDQIGIPVGMDDDPQWETFVAKCVELFGIKPELFEGFRPEWA